MKKKTNSPVVTEEYLDETLGIRFGLFEDKIMREVKDMFTQNFSRFYSRIDPLLSELEDRRLDRDFGTEQIANLEVRVTKLENKN
jgi:polyhydroxyalkanoate synthesis regulator phasin